MTDQQRARVTAMTGVGKPIHHRRKRGVGHDRMGKIVDEVFHIVGDYKHVIQKVLLPEDLRIKWDGSEHAYRTGYWTYSGNGKRIVWGQYTQFLTEVEYRILLQKARDKGWSIF
jgi:hypothetical protein